MLPSSPRCRHYPAAQCPAAGCCDCSPAPAASPSPRTRWGPGNSGHRAGRLASWYETGAGGPAVIHGIIYVSSLILLCWWYLHLRDNHRQPGDLALQEVNCVTVVLTLAGWRHGTKRGRGPRWLIIVLMVVSSPPCPSSPARMQETWHCKRWIL